MELLNKVSPAVNISPSTRILCVSCAINLCAVLWNSLPATVLSRDCYKTTFNSRRKLFYTTALLIACMRWRDINSYHLLTYLNTYTQFVNALFAFFFNYVEQWWWHYTELASLARLRSAHRIGHSRPGWTISTPLISLMRLVSPSTDRMISITFSNASDSLPLCWCYALVMSAHRVPIVSMWLFHQTQQQWTRKQCNNDGVWNIDDSSASHVTWLQ